MHTVNMAIEAPGQLIVPLALQRLYICLQNAVEANRVLAWVHTSLSHAAAGPCSKQLPHLQPGLCPGHHITFLPVPAMHIGACMSSILVMQTV